MKNNMPVGPKLSNAVLVKILCTHCNSTVCIVPAYPVGLPLHVHACSVICASVSGSIRLPVRSTANLAVLSVRPSISQSVHLSVHLPVNLSIAPQWRQPVEAHASAGGSTYCLPVNMSTAPQWRQPAEAHVRDDLDVIVGGDLAGVLGVSGVSACGNQGQAVADATEAAGTTALVADQLWAREVHAAVALQQHQYIAGDTQGARHGLLGGRRAVWHA
jgi:hypothetical protein